MTPTGEVDLRSDSGYRRLSGDADDEINGYGTRGANLLRRGSTPSGKPLVRSSYSAETFAAAHNLEDCYPTIVTLREPHSGPLTPTLLKDALELGGLSIKVTLTIDAGTPQLDTTDDGARNGARGDHQQRNAPTGHGGTQSFKHDLMRHAPHRAGQTSRSAAA
eukprot:2043714-Pyramimonas_sp.AAC.1